MEEKYRDRINDAINDSQSDFEKNLVYLSAGALTLSMGFIEKIIPISESTAKSLIVISWILLAATLLLNLATHLISVRNSTKSREEMDAEMEFETLIQKISCRNKIMTVLNWVTYVLFSIGVILTVIFCSINL